MKSLGTSAIALCGGCGPMQTGSGSTMVVAKTHDSYSNCQPVAVEEIHFIHYSTASLNINACRPFHSGTFEFITLGKITQPTRHSTSPALFY